MDGCYTRLLRAALNSWRDKVTNEDLYGDLLKVTKKGRFPLYQEEAAGTLVLWDPRHESPRSRHNTYVQVLLEDTGLENISKLISLVHLCSGIQDMDHQGHTKKLMCRFSLKILN